MDTTVDSIVTQFGAVSVVGVSLVVDGDGDASPELTDVEEAVATVASVIAADAGGAVVPSTTAFIAGEAVCFGVVLQAASTAAMARPNRGAPQRLKNTVILIIAPKSLTSEMVLPFT
jgi:hypothetical protein